MELSGLQKSIGYASGPPYNCLWCPSVWVDEPVTDPRRDPTPEELNGVVYALVELGFDESQIETLLPGIHNGRIGCVDVDEFVINVKRALDTLILHKK